jgi:hypothetical protein
VGNQQIVFREYTKDVFPIFNGYGVVIHTVAASCKDPAKAVIEHSFGRDEGLNEFVELGDIIEAYRLGLNNIQPVKNRDYSFVINNGTAPDEPVMFTEIMNMPNEKKFQLKWQTSFGRKKRASYSWGWMNRVMFSSYTETMEQSSSLKLNYPTGKLKLRIFLPKLFPLDENPCLEMQNSKGQKARLRITNEVGVLKEDIGFSLKVKEDFKCYQIEIFRPNLDETYKITWSMGIKQLPKYLAWLEASN